MESNDSNAVATPITREQGTTESSKDVSPQSSGNDTTIQPPYSEYESKNGKPYSVDYFDLGSYWDHADLYTKEIGTIETYMKHLVDSGEVNNTLEAVTDKYKRIEKMINLDKNDRKAKRVAMVAAHFEFLIKADDIKRNTAKYGRT